VASKLSLKNLISALNCRLFSSAMICMALTGPVYGQSNEKTPQAEPDSTITVTGTKTDKKEIIDKATRFVGVMASPVIGQYSRRHEPICPQVFGIDQSYNKIIYKKIRDIAKQIGVSDAGYSCRTNLLIIFSENTTDYIAKKRKDIPPLFDQVPFSEREILFKKPLPVRWWYLSELKDDYGDSMGVQEDTAGQIPRFVFSQNSSQSLIYSNIQADLMASVVLVDLNLAKGYSLESIAAYAAMVSLVQLRNDRAFDGVNSILNMFASGKSAKDAPTDLTRWDYAFAQSLYEIKSRNSGSAQKSQLVRRIATKLSEE
jgi:hypothetical protein